ncbi:MULTISPECIES: hypothetical protein [Streptomyces]|uniref:hypothetical protein n=1 Tax=Streptomyces TaxID=1883 RepID=UPI0004CD6935|nr:MULTISPECIES: hypothetical protein [Streptomyces]
MYRIFSIDLERQRIRGKLKADMVLDASAPGGYTTHVPAQRGSADRPSLSRFWTNQARLHTAQVTHPTATGVGECTQLLVCSGRVLLDPAGV